MHQMTRTVSTCYSQVEEHGRLAPAGCTVTLHPRSRNPERGGASARAGCGQVRQATTDELLTAGSRGRDEGQFVLHESTVFDRGNRRNWFNMPPDAFS